MPSQVIFHGDAGYGPAYEQAVAHVQRLGHRIVALDFTPLHAVAALLYGGPWVAERHTVIEALLERDPEAIDPVVRTVIGAARTMSATDAFRGLYALRAAQRDTAAIWEQVDLLMVPSTSGHPRHAEVDAEPIAVNAQLGTYTNFVNLLGWCALAVPAGFTAAELPFGVTFIAPHAHDAALAGFGAAWQASLALPLGATTRSAAPRAADAPAPPMPASAPTVAIAVVGAHLSGLPLNPQLLALGAYGREATRTAPCYRLFALPDTTPPKPGLLRVAEGGARDRGRGLDAAERAGWRLSCVDRRAPRPRHRRARGRTPGARIPVRSARARRRRGHHRARRLARLSREPIFVCRGHAGRADRKPFDFVNLDPP